MRKDLVVHTQAGDVLLTDSTGAASAFAKDGGCVIGLCPEETLHTIDFPDAAVLVSEEKADSLSEAFIRKTACHFYGKPFRVASTRRLVIRESTGEDYEAVYSLLKACEETDVKDAGGTQAAGRYRIIAEGFDLKEIDSRDKFLQYVNACYRFFGFGVWSVLLKRQPGQDDDSDQDGMVIGWCGLFPAKAEGDEGFHIELGYALAPAFRGKGYGYEACRAILDYAQSELELESGQILVRADERNAAALGLAQKLGLTIQTISKTG
ncbi:MAG: GNAT family N-acetyltransferase [Lachnospiraceae bacterium]|nr:GNAT family N-acetyltransferase [Lachnospiraceae bacterium]